MQEKWIFLIIALLSLTLVALVALIAFLGLKLLKDKELGSSIQGPDGQSERLLEIKKEALKAQQGLEYCQNHPKDAAQGICAICSKPFCEVCIKEHDGLSFCSAHFRLYLTTEWEAIEEIKTTPDTPESALVIYDFKKKLWTEEEGPSLISTHYKINIEGDEIESYVKLLVQKSEKDKLKEKYEKYSIQKYQ